MSDRRRLAETVRDACLETLLAAWERAGMSGLCAEGRWEIALAALRDLDLEPLVAVDGSASGSALP